jgi:hypothetical protein
MLNSTISRLLISVNSVDEFEIAFDSKVPWIDFKDPKVGALGQPSLSVVRDSAKRFAEIMGRNVDAFRGGEFQWSIAGGELLEWAKPREWSLPTRVRIEALGDRGAIKWGLTGCQRRPDWKEHFASLVEGFPNREQVILAHYADHQRVGAPDWNDVFTVAHGMGMRRILIDTAVKDGTGLLDHVPIQRLVEQIDQVHRVGMEIAIAGSLRFEGLEKVRCLGADWIGLRGGVCRDPNDRNSPVARERIELVMGRLKGERGR